MSTYEERLTLWAVPDFERAVRTAEREAQDYAESMAGCTYVGLAQVFHLPDSPDHGTEVFSLMRDSALDPDAERQGEILGD